MYHYRITRVAHTYVLLDSVGVSDSLITNVERQTIQLYFRTAAPDDPEADTPAQSDPSESSDQSAPSDNPDNPANDPTEGETSV